jgi:Holliday junction resolvasome RuvABC endonuclease subunit
MIEVMGGDPSLSKTGICLPDGSVFHIDTGDATRGDVRLWDLERALLYYLESRPPALAVLEDLPTHSKGNVAVMGMAHGIVRKCIAQKRIPRALIVPATLKMFATGHGNADKAEMIHAANIHRKAPHVTPHMNLLGEPNCRGCKGEMLAPITDDNEADAWWLRQMGLWWMGDESLGELEPIGFDGHGLRHRCVYGPWKNSGGAKWPPRGSLTTPARATRGRPVHR